MREVGFARRVDPPQQLLVGLVASAQAETDQRERMRRHNLEPRIVLKAVGEALGEGDAMSDVRTQPLRAIPPQHEPQLQRPEPAPERYLPVAVVDDGAGLGGGIAQVLR